MIKNLIFDFGDVFINLDKEGAMEHALNLFKLSEFPEDLNAINSLFEQGLISSEEFLEFYMDNFPDCSKKDILNAWNFILKDFPEYRLEFIQQLKNEGKYKLILLSNTNELHIDWITKEIPCYEDFKAAFDEFYLSHEIQLRKPDDEIYQFVLDQNKLNPNETLFIDDTEENTKTADKIGIHTWLINPKADDITQLFTTKKELF